MTMSDPSADAPRQHPRTPPVEKRRGPVTLRRSQVQTTTTDQRLLDSRGPSDWVHTDPWRVLRIQSEFVEGFGLLSELGAAVSVFGSARTRPDSPDYQAAEKLAQAANVLAQTPIAVQLRFLQTMREVASERNTTTFFPIPVDLFAPFLKSLEGAGAPKP